MEPLYRPAVIQRLLRAHGLSPNKGLGQNFLADGNTVRRIVAAAGIEPGDPVVEIGPGLGALTQGLAEAGANVVAVEKDAGLVGVLNELFGDAPNVRIVRGDALEMDLRRLSADFVEADAARAKVVANLPYYITSPLLMRVLESHPPFQRAVVMVQKEVADRLVAPAGSKAYGALTVAAAYWAEATLAGRVPPSVFVPPPKVESQIVVLQPRPCPWDAGDVEAFFRVVKAAFGQRRKRLANALKSLDLPSSVIEEALQAAGIDPSRRGETLTLEEFSVLSRTLAGG